MTSQEKCVTHAQTNTERSVEEIVGEFEEKIDAIHMHYYKEHMMGAPREQITNHFRTGLITEKLNHCCCVIENNEVIESCKLHAQTLQAERQKQDEMVEVERERIGNSMLEQLEKSPKIRALKSISECFRAMVVKALTQPNNK